MAALEVEDWIPVKPGTIGSLSDYIRMGGGDHQDFLAVKRALQRFPVLWSSPAQMPKAREWDPGPKELVVYHVRRFKLEKAEPTYTQTIRWFQRVFNITNPVVWCEEDKWG